MDFAFHSLLNTTASAMSAALESIDKGINFALRKTKNNHLNLKVKQRKVIQSTVSRRDTIVVLSLGFGMSLNMYQL